MRRSAKGRAPRGRLGALCSATSLRPARVSRPLPSRARDVRLLDARSARAALRRARSPAPQQRVARSGGPSGSSFLARSRVFARACVRLPLGPAASPGARGSSARGPWQPLNKCVNCSFYQVRFCYRKRRRARLQLRKSLLAACKTLDIQQASQSRSRNVAEVAICNTDWRF